ncbi:hypothetical protein ACT2FY_13060 [Paraburkholderia fungorum]|uniref:hypothetical protein n=1 Tax=Paraburkholderia fungorum TaxID=134537 RepID=UPI00402B1C94
MALTAEQVERLRTEQREYVAKRLPRAVREARSKSQFEKVGGGRLRRKSSNPRRWREQMLRMDAWRSVSLLS